MDELRRTRVAVLGAGIIGGAIAESLAEDTGLEVTATRRKLERLEPLRKRGIRITRDNREAASAADAVILAVKPKQVVPLLQEIRDCLAGKLVISFAAAISMDIVSRVVPEARVIRAMTNTSVLIRKGYTVYALGPDLTEADRALAEALFEGLGTAQQVEEQYMDVLTAMSGSGPAYIYTVVESMIYGALRVGLPRDLALQAAAHTAIGASHLLLSSGRHAAELRDMVVTPGGVTIEGIYELEESRIRTAFMKAISAASAKAEELARVARDQAERQMESPPRRPRPVAPREGETAR
jgi:pyrroline-5-carboxylate reductase